MAVRVFQSTAAEVLDGTADNDTFVASNFNLNAGDRANGGAGIDEFQYFADSTLTGSGPLGTGDRNFAAFVLDSVEIFTTTNDAGRQINFDLSSSQDITDLVVANSTAAVVYDQVTTLANVRLFNQTNVATADVAVGYQASVVAGASTNVNVTLDRTNGDVVRLGTATATLGSPTNTGIESVFLTGVGGDSTIGRLDTDLTTLLIGDTAGAFGITINTALNTTVRTITSQTDGNVTLSWANNAVGVTYTGASIGTGINRLTAGAGNDVINTFAGADVVNAAGGDDTVNVGNGDNVVQTGTGVNSVISGTGNDTVYAQGSNDTLDTGLGNDIVDMRGNTGRVSLTSGDGSDLVIATGGVFNAATGAGNDNLNLGANFDVLIVDAGTVDANYRQVTQLDGLAIFTGGTTTLQGANSGGTQNAQAAGINTVYLISGSGTADTVNAGTFSSALTIVSYSSDAALTNAVDADGRITATGRFNNFTAGGGNDTVTSGGGSDFFLFRGDNNLTDADNLDGGAQTGSQTDSLNLNGDTTLAGGASFRNFEFLALESAVSGQYRQNPGADLSGNQYNLTITNANAPSAGQLLTIAGNNLQAAGAQVFTLDANGAPVAVAGATLATSENAIINAGAVTNFGLQITTGAGQDNVTTSQFGDIVQTQGGNDTITDGGAGNDRIDPGLGNDTVILVGGNNTVQDEGGDNTITLGSGNDTVLVATGNDRIIAGTQLNANDTLIDGGGIDTIAVSGRNYVDANFSNVNNTAFGLQGFEILDVSGAFTFTLAANAQRAGFRTIIASDNAASIIDAGQFTRPLRVDLSAGGNDVVTLGSPTALATTGSNVFPGTQTFAPGVVLDFMGEAPGSLTYNINDVTANANLVIAGTGDQQVVGGTGTDVLRVRNAQLTTADQFRGGAGLDVVQLDNRFGTVTAAVNLGLVSSVELYQFTMNGVLSPNDAATHTLRFGNANTNTVTTLTRITVDTSALTDTADQSTITLDVTLNDADFAFNVLGNSTTTTLVKENVGVNNNINFQGGSGIDTFIVNGGDLGSTTIFNGNGGTDVIAQAGGLVTDDSYVSVSNVEILTGAAGFAVNATLGDSASDSGLIVVRGTTLSDTVFLDPEFTTALRMELGNGGNDVYNAGNSAAVITFAVRNDFLTNADVLTGGTTASDVLEITTPLGSSAGDATSVTGVETINVRLPGQTAAITATTLTIDTLIGEVNGGIQTINAVETAPDNGSQNNDFRLNGQTTTANLFVNSSSGWDIIQTGSGNDTISTGAGQDRINARGGTNVVDAGADNDDVITGSGTDTITLGTGSDTAQAGGGSDTVNGGDGIDFIRGQGGDDTLNGDGGNDQIQGGVGVDTMDGGAGNDTFFYQGRNESNLVVGGRDTINNFVSGSDTIDALSVAEAIATYGAGAQVAFRGNQANFGDAQSVINDNDGIFDIVYQQDTNTLWFDLNDDGTLNADDLQIIVNTVGDVGLVGGDVLAGQTVGGGGYTAFDAVFPTF